MNLHKIYPHQTTAAYPSRINHCSYVFTFVSLISPNLLTNVGSLTSLTSSASGRSSKILLKQSYLIFTWFYYLKHATPLKSSREGATIRFASLPNRLRSYTLTKAPMAHKTNSKEQITSKFFKLKATFRASISSHNMLSSVDQALLALLLVKLTFPVFETNLLLLKNYALFLPFRTLL